MNLARDDVVDKLMHLSIETRELIENCEIASEDTKLFKAKSEILEEEVRRVSSENVALKKENEILKDKLYKKEPSEECWVSIVENANQTLRNITPNVAHILEKLNTSENDRIRLERELVAVKEENANLRIEIEERNVSSSKQCSDFLNLKKMVDDYRSEITRLDAELQDCHSRVSTLNEHLEVINAENLDLAEYTNFKGLLKKLGTIEDVNEVIAKLQTMYEIEEFCDKKLSPRMDILTGDQTAGNLSEYDSKICNVSKVKDCLEKAFFVIEKLNESNTHSCVEYENKIRSKDDEIAKLKELSYHLGLYNEILEKSLKQQRSNNSEAGNNIVEKTDRLVIAAKALHDDFEQLRRLYGHSRLYNDQLFAKFSQLRLWCRILKIRINKMSSRCDDDAEATPLSPLNDFFRLMDELFGKVAKKRQDFDQRMSDSNQIFASCEAGVIANDCLKNTVDNMTLEVKRLTGQVERQMSKNLREIESLKGEMDLVKTDNLQLASKIKNCNREIISLTTENYDLNEKLSKFSQIESDVNAQKHKAVDLAALQTRCSQFKNENQNLKVAVQSIHRQMHDEISSLKKNLQDVLISQTQTKLTVDRADVDNLLERCQDLKRHNKQIRDDADCFSSLNDTIETARVTLSHKLENASRDLNRLQSDLNATIDDKNQYKELVSKLVPSILVITQDLKSSQKLLSNLIETCVLDFNQFSSTVQQNIQEAVTHTIEHVKNSTTLSNEEVIKEMQEVNSELKNRSETIFLLNQRVDELIKENDHLSQSLAQQKKLTNDLNDQLSTQLAMVTEKESQINSINDDLMNLTSHSGSEMKKKDIEIADLTEALEKTKTLLRSKEDTIATLEAEISKVKDIQAADGDVSSMGNISRTEEVSRLRDVEDSFEERYMKLRCIAVKMKKNIADLTQQLLNEKSERNAIQCKLNIATEQAKRNQALQEECDRINDELELKMKEIKELKKIIIEADSKIEKSDTVTKQYEILSAQNKDLEIEKKNLTSSVEQLKKEKFVEETMKKEMEKEIQRLKQKVKENEDNMKKNQSDLEQANLELRKRDTLTLEMRDYDKTISDLTEKLKAKNLIVEELNEKIKINVESNMTLVERIKGLEAQISSFGAGSKLADEQILNLNKVISAHERDLEIRDNLLKQSKQQLEEEKSKNELLTLQLAESVTEANDFKERLRNMQESSNSQLKLSQNSAKILEEQLKKKESEFDKLKEDFEAYKIRAHNVLQKHKNENNLKNNEEKLKMKIDDLSQIVKELRKRLDDTLADLDNHKAELKLLQDFKENSLAKIREVQKTCAEKTKELDNVNIEFKSFKTNNETLIKCYKNEIENLHATCQELEMKLQDVRLPKEPEVLVEENNNPKIQAEMKSDHVPVEKLDDRGHSKTNTQPNEVEKVVRKKSQNHELVSLEKLLKTDITEEPRVSGDIAELREKIEKLESQVSYLNGVLNESEKNAARSEQHVAWLKDVNRRLQKTIDRAPHLQNGEYLKNVLFNFFTFPDGEEKCKLITILDTLLQLTPEERSILSAIAKGERNEQKRSSGFASFLKFG